MQVRATQRTGRVLVIDDEPEVADLYATWLESDHEVLRAYDGEGGLERLDDCEAVDVAVLDRQMPGLTGDDVLDAIEERGVDCRVIMVTAVDPGFDIVEMPFDDYLTKPVTREQLAGAVQNVLARDTYDEQIREYFALASKKAALEAEKNPTELAESDAYAEIERRVADLRDQADATVSQFDSLAGLFRELPGGDSG